MKTKMFILMLVLGCLLAMSVYAAKQSPTKKATAPAIKTDSAPIITVRKMVTLKTEMDKVSYAIGVELGQNFKSQSIDIKLDLMIQGLKDSMANQQLALTQEEIKQLMATLSQRMKAQQQERQKLNAAKNLAAGKAFLEANKKRDSIKVLPSGLQYKVIKKGTGKTPTAADKVKAHYRGTLIDGSELDSSYKAGKPAEFVVQAPIKGWTEALQLMKEGAKWELYIPANLAYGERGNRGIPANSALIFEIEVLEVVK